MRFQASAAVRRASRRRLLAGLFSDFDCEYTETSDDSADGGWGILELGTSGWVRGRPLNVRATRSEDSAAAISHCTDVFTGVRSAKRTSARCMDSREDR